MPHKQPTKAERARFQRLQEMGCICCRIFAGRYRAPDIHHLVEGGRRLGHSYTIPLCEWHHRGLPPDPWGSPPLAERFLGPSLAISKRRFKAVFGTEREMLATTNKRLEEAA